MGSILKFIFATLLLFIVVTIAAFVYLPWWGALLVVLAMALLIVGGIRYVMANLGKMLGKAMLKAFDVKSRVLRDAKVTVNHVEATLAPAREERKALPSDDGDGDSEEEEGADEEAATLARAYYRIDVTIQPRATSGEGGMTHWDVDDLRLVPHDDPRPSLDLLGGGDANAFNEGYDLQNVQILEDGQFVSDEQGKHHGAKQLRATVGVPVHVRRLKFQYYTEQFGAIDLPQPLPSLS